MDDGFGYGSIAVIGVAATGIGWLLGGNQAKKKVNHRWFDALSRCCEKGVPTGSDLDESERVALFGALKRHAETKLGLNLDDGIVHAMQSAAKDIMSKVGVNAWTTGKDTDAAKADIFLREVLAV